MSGKSTEDLFSANFQYMINLFSTALFRNYFSLEDDCFTVLCVSAINGHEAAVDMPQSPDSCTSLSLPHTIPPPHPIIFWSPQVWAEPLSPAWSRPPAPDLSSRLQDPAREETSTVRTPSELAREPS